MNILLDPNVAYFLLIGGLVLGIVAVFTPGTGLVELGALFSLALAVYGLVNLPVNSWAITLVIVGFIPYLFTRRKALRKYLIPGSMLLILGGSLLIFRAQSGVEAANLPLITVIALVATSLLWLIAIKGTEANQQPPSMNLDALTGMSAVALTDIAEEGTVHVNGEDWTARSTRRIPAGSQLRITGRQGLILLVEAVEEAHASSDRVQ